MARKRSRKSSPIQVGMKKNVYGIVIEEEIWRGTTLNLLASENHIPASARKLLASDLGGRYTLPIGAEIHGEYVRNGYGGTRYADAVTELAQDLFNELYGAEWCDVRPLSGHIAAMSILYHARRKGFERFMAVPPENGGYDGYMQRYLPDILGLRSIPIPMNGTDIDMERFKESFAREKPDMVVLGQSFFTHPYDLKAIREIIGEGTFLAYDGSHVLGLIAGKRFQPDAIEYCDVLYGSTHKTFPGPQGGVAMGRDRRTGEEIFNDYIWSIVDNTHLHRIAATARVCEILLEVGETYAETVIGSARTLAEGLAAREIPLLEDRPTYSHQILLDLGKIRDRYGLGGQDLCDLLERNSIIIDAVGRMGTAELAQTSPTKKEISTIAGYIRDALSHRDVRSDVEELNLTMKERGSILERGHGG